MKIYKYQFDLDQCSRTCKTPEDLGMYQTFDFHFPKSEPILKVGEQGNAICLWAWHDPEWTNPVQRTFVIYGTGWDVPDLGHKKYIDSVITSDGFVWHIFEVF